VVSRRTGGLVPRPRPLPPKHPNARGGFSVIELMVALTILGIGILGLANDFPLGSSTQIRDRLRTSAADQAQQTMEQLRTLSWSAADLTDGTHPNTSGETLTLQNEGTYNRRWIVENQTGNFSDMKRVTVQVTWVAARPETVNMVSYFRR
jgi:prepilin-type N-terminal cleavage/methylation domain-containing protein